MLRVIIPGASFIKGEELKQLLAADYIEASICEVADEGTFCLALTAADSAPRAQIETLRAHLAAVLECSDDAILCLSVEGRVLSWNRGAQKMYGYDAQDVTQCALLVAEGQPDIMTGSLGALSRGERVTGVETLHRRKDGSLLNVLLNLSPVIDARGHVVAIVAVARDLTAWRRAEAALRNLRRAVEQAADGMFMTNRDGVIEYANPAFEDLMAVTNDQLVGSTPRLFKSGTYDDAFYESLWATILRGEMFRSVLIDRRGDGNIIYLDETIAPVRDADGNITHFLASARDVTQQVRGREALRRLNDGLEQQARRIAQALHDEAGQFLTSAHIALNDIGRDLPVETRDRLQDVRRHLDRVEEQLRRVAHELRPKILDDLGLVPALEFLTAGVQRRRGIIVALQAAVQRRLPPAVETTVYRFAQEGLSNVSRHSHAARVKIHLEQGPHELRCTIQDDGVGFDATALLRGEEEKGLGLSGIRDRLDALGGSLDIITAPGCGTELRIAIPLES